MSYCTINSWMEMSVIKDGNFWSKGGGKGDVDAWEPSLVAVLSAAVISLLLTQRPIHKQEEFSFSIGRKRDLRG